MLAMLLAAILYIPALRHLFGFGILHWDDLLLGGGASAVLLYGLEAGKPWLSPLSGRHAAHSNAGGAPSGT